MVNQQSDFYHVLWRRPRGAGASSHRIDLRLSRYQRSRFCSKMAQPKTGSRIDFILSPVFGSEMAQQNPDCQGLEGGDFFCVAPRQKNATRTLIVWISVAEMKEPQSFYTLRLHDFLFVCVDSSTTLFCCSN